MRKTPSRFSRDKEHSGVRARGGPEAKDGFTPAKTIKTTAVHQTECARRRISAVEAFHQASNNCMWGFYGRQRDIYDREVREATHRVFEVEHKSGIVYMLALSFLRVISHKKIGSVILS